MTRKQYERNLRKLEREALIELLLEAWDGLGRLRKAQPKGRELDSERAVKP